MDEKKIKKIQGMLEKLEALKKATEEYQEKFPNLPIAGTPDPSGNQFWSESVQELVNKIELGLVGLENVINEYTLPQDNFGGWVIPTAGTSTQNLWRDIKHALTSRKPKDVNELLKHLKKVQERLKLKNPAEAEQNIAPAKRQRIKKITARIFKKTSAFIYALVFFLAALLAIFSYLGWLDQFKAFIYNILSPK